VYSLLEYPTTCGIIGGVGPAATADFFSKVVTRQFSLFHALQESVRAGHSLQQNVQAVRNYSSADWNATEVERLAIFPRDIAHSTLDDQHHVPVMIYDNPQIPDRTAYILEKMNISNTSTSLDPAPLLRKTARSLTSGGATCVAVTCNTAHYFLPDIKQAVPSGVNVLNMLELTILHAVRWLGTNLKLGLLSTTGTARTQIYTHVAAQVSSKTGASINIVTPMDLQDGNQSAVMEAIYGAQGIKAGFADVATPEGKNNLMLLAQEGEKLTNAGCAAIILGCTEIPLVVTEENIAKIGLDKGIRILNPTAVLVDEVIHRTLVDRYLPKDTKSMVEASLALV